MRIIKRSSTDFFLHIRSSSFAVSVQTLYSLIFLFLSQTFLSVARRWLQHSYRCLEKHGSPNVRTHRRNVIYLWALAWINPGNLVSGTEFSGTLRQSSSKHVKPGSPIKIGTNGIPNRGTAHRSTPAPYVHASQHLGKTRCCNFCLPCRRLILLFICVLLFQKPTNGNKAYVVRVC